MTIQSKTYQFLVLSALLSATTAFAQVILIEDGSSIALDPNVSTTGTWAYRTEAQHGGTYLDTGSRFSSSGTIQYSSSLPTAGVWGLEVWVTNTLNSNNSSVSFTTSSGTVSPTMQQGSMDLASTDQWLSLGHYNFDSGANNLTLTANGANQNSDAVRWVRLDADPSAATAVVTGVAGGISPDFYQESGSWISSSNRFGVYDLANRLSSELGATATFSAPIEAFQYEVRFTWNFDSSRSKDTLVEVFDAHGATHQFRIDQSVAVLGDTYLGVDWMSLGTFDLNANSTLKVIADGTALASGSHVVADGVQFIAVIPEPGTLALLGFAVGTVLLFHRRK
jgi:hypothetical protein